MQYMQISKAIESQNYPLNVLPQAIVIKALSPQLPALAQMYQTGMYFGCRYIFRQINIRKVKHSLAHYEW